MDQEKDYIVGKSLIENSHGFVALFNAMTKRALSKAMGIHKATLENRRANIGTTSVDELITLSENLQVDVMKVAEFAIRERMAERQKARKKGK